LGFIFIFVIFHLHLADNNNFWAGKLDFSKIKADFCSSILFAQNSHAAHAQMIIISYILLCIFLIIISNLRFL
jgi:hypothetical protein